MTESYSEGIFLGGSPERLGITKPEEGAQAFLREFWLGQRAVKQGLSLQEMGYYDTTMTRPRLYSVRSESLIEIAPTNRAFNIDNNS